MKLTQSKLPLALMLALVSSQVQALGLGQIEVKSGLSQPLVAEIPILSATAEELDALEVRLASPEAFARVGLDHPSGLTANLQMQVVRNEAGKPVVRVTTRNAFNEPFVTFLLEASWGKGGVVREFSALVDPPYIAPAVIQPIEAPAVAVAPAPVFAPEPEVVAPEAVTAEPAAAESVAVVEPAPPSAPATLEPEPVKPAPAAEPVAAAPLPAPAAEKPQPPAPAPSPPRPAPAAVERADTFGPVSAGQTLWSIAEKVRPNRSVTANQMMLALQRANPEAFIDNNINRLKRGAVLRIPSAQDVSSIDAAQAAALVREHAQTWQARRSPAPQPVAAREAPASAAAKPTTAAKPATKQADQGRLAIVPPVNPASAVKATQSGASNVGGGAELRAELSQAKAELGQTKEALTARQAEVKELTSRISDLEAQQADRQRLIDLQNSQLKAMQDRLAQVEAEAAEKTEQAEQAPVEPVAAEAEASVDASPVAAASEANPPETDVASVKSEAPAAPAANTQHVAWYSNPLILGGAGVVALLTLLLARRRGRQRPSPFPPRRISDDEAFVAGLGGGSVAADDAASDAAAAMAQVASDEVSVGDDNGFVADANDEALLALREAVAADPDNLDTHLALLQHLHASHDALAYEAAAADMHGYVASFNDPRWRQAVVMGMLLAPENPLFADAGWNSPRMADRAISADEPVSEQDAPAPVSASTDAHDDALVVDDMASVVAELPHEDEAVLTFDSVVGGDEPEMLSITEAAVTEPAPDQAAEDWERMLAEAAQQSESSEHAVEPLDIAAPDSDIHRVEAEVLAEDEASSTKIELAKAYLEIGDAEGARAMLEEVVAEGGPIAKAEAERLIREIG